MFEKQIIPKPIEDKMQELYNLVEANPQYISVPDVASFLGMNTEGLRNSIENNTCPFGIMWQKSIHGNKAFKIPTAKFFFWYAKDYVEIKLKNAE